MSNPTLNDFKIGNLTYNGFEFPTLSEISASVESVYDDSTNVVKWYQIDLSVKFIYYPTAEEVPEDLAQGLTYDDSSALPTYMSRLANNLKQRLLQPAQPFSMTGMGFGDVTSTSGYFDVDGGPKPSRCTWAPVVGNIIAQFTWECTICLPPGCINGIISSTGITYLNYSVDWEQNEDSGFQFIRTISGKVGFLNRRQQNLLGNKAYSSMESLEQNLKNKIVPVLKTLFPKPFGYMRSKRYGINEANRELRFTFTDAEIMTDAAPPRPILSQRLRQGIRSTLDQGFNIWTITFSGECTVAKARNQQFTSFASQKKLAWVAIGAMITKRLNLAQGITYTNPEGETDKTKILIDSISIDDNVNENSFSFSLQYRLFTNPKLLFPTTGLFSTMDIPGETWQTREAYLEAIQSQEQPFNPWPMDNPPTPDICTFLTGFGSNESNSNKSEPASYSEQGTEPIRKVTEKSSSYLKYENGYILEEMNQSSVHIPIFNAVEGRREVVRTSDPEGISPVADNSIQANAPLPVVHNPTARTYLITMTGFALRAGLPSTPPNLVSYAGKPCTKIGRDQIHMKERIVGVVLDPNETSTTVYRTDWKKTYIVIGNIAPSDIGKRVTDRTSVSPQLISQKSIA